MGKWPPWGDRSTPAHCLEALAHRRNVQHRIPESSSAAREIHPTQRHQHLHTPGRGQQRDRDLLQGESTPSRQEQPASLTDRKCEQPGHTLRLQSTAPAYQGPAGRKPGGASQNQPTPSSLSSLYLLPTEGALPMGQWAQSSSLPRTGQADG